MITGFISNNRNQILSVDDDLENMLNRIILPSIITPTNTKKSIDDKVSNLVQIDVEIYNSQTATSYSKLVFTMSKKSLITNKWEQIYSSYPFTLVPLHRFNFSMSGFLWVW